MKKHLIELGTLALAGCVVGVTGGFWIPTSAPSSASRGISSIAPPSAPESGELFDTEAKPRMAGDRAQDLIGTFKVNLATIGYPDGDYSRDLDNPNSGIRKLLDALEMIKYGQFQPYPAGVVQDKTYADFVTSNNTGIIGLALDSENSDAPKCSAGSQNDEGACHVEGVGPVLLKPSFSSEKFVIGAAATLIHQARHAGGFPHIDCAKSATASVCDPSFSEGGGFAAEDEYLARVALYGKNFSPALKTIARQLLLTDIEHYNDVSSGPAREGQQP